MVNTWFPWLIAAIALGMYADSQLKTHPQWAMLMAFFTGICTAAFAVRLATS